MLRRELSLAGNVLREGRSLIVVLNKVDSLSEADQETVRREIPTQVRAFQSPVEKEIIQLHRSSLESIVSHVLPIRAGDHYFA